MVLYFSGARKSNYSKQQWGFCFILFFFLKEFVLSGAHKSSYTEMWSTSRTATDKMKCKGEVSPSLTWLSAKASTFQSYEA